MWRWMPPGVSIHTSRMPIASEVTEQSLIEMASASVDSARLLADCGVDLILYGCTSGSFIKGMGFDEKVEEDIRAATGIRTVSTSSCVLDALRRTDATRMAVYTPYIDEVNERARGFLEDNGFEVTTLFGLGLIDNTAVGRISPADVFKMVFENDRGGADLVFISCTNLRTLEIIAPLSKVLGIPVVTSNQASMEGALRALRREDLSESGLVKPWPSS